MLRVAMSFTKNVLDVGLNFLLKTCLWGIIKLSLFDVVFLYQFCIKFSSILTALDTQNLSKKECTPWQNCLSYRISLQDQFLIDFGDSKASPRRLKTPQDGSKTVSRRFQDGSRRLWTLPRRLPTLSQQQQSTASKDAWALDLGPTKNNKNTTFKATWTVYNIKPNR